MCKNFEWDTNQRTRPQLNALNREQKMNILKELNNRFNHMNILNLLNVKNVELNYRTKTYSESEVFFMSGYHIKHMLAVVRKKLNIQFVDLILKIMMNRLEDVEEQPTDDNTIGDIMLREANKIDNGFIIMTNNYVGDIIHHAEYKPIADDNYCDSIHLIGTLGETPVYTYNYESVAPFILVGKHGEIDVEVEEINCGFCLQGAENEQAPDGNGGWYDVLTLDDSMSIKSPPINITGVKINCSNLLKGWDKFI